MFPKRFSYCNFLSPSWLLALWKTFIHIVDIHRKIHDVHIHRKIPRWLGMTGNHPWSCRKDRNEFYFPEEIRDNWRLYSVVSEIVEILFWCIIKKVSWIFVLRQLTPMKSPQENYPADFFPPYNYPWIIFPWTNTHQTIGPYEILPRTITRQIFSPGQ